MCTRLRLSDWSIVTNWIVFIQETGGFDIDACLAVPHVIMKNIHKKTIVGSPSPSSLQSLFFYWWTRGGGKSVGTESHPFPDASLRGSSLRLALNGKLTSSKVGSFVQKCFGSSLLEPVCVRAALEGFVLLLLLPHCCCEGRHDPSDLKSPLS